MENKKQEEEFVTLKHDHSVIIVDRTGAALSAYYLEREDGKRINVCLGYDRDCSEKQASMGNVMCPFTGRVEKGRYVWHGVEYEIGGTKVDPNGNAIHGFTHLERWDCKVNVETHSIQCTYMLNAAEFGVRGYPHSLRVEIMYKLLDSDAGLEVTTKVSNLGKSVAPLGVGFHPFFTVLGQRDDGDQCHVDDMMVEVPARKLIEFDDKLKPTGRLIDVNDAGKLHFDGKSTIGKVVIDNCYTALTFVDGKATTTLRDSRNSNACIRVWQDQNLPYIQLYSLDKKESSVYRKALAIEPQSCCGFSYNVEGLGLKSLDPEETWSGTWGVIHEGLL